MRPVRPQGDLGPETFWIFGFFWLLIKTDSFSTSPHHQLDDVMTMIEKNIFRPLPNVKKQNLAFSETGVEAEDEVDPAWPHLQGIYEFFLQLVINEAVEVLP